MQFEPMPAETFALSFNLFQLANEKLKVPFLVLAELICRAIRIMSRYVINLTNEKGKKENHTFCKHLVDLEQARFF